MEMEILSHSRHRQLLWGFINMLGYRRLVKCGSHRWKSVAPSALLNESAMAASIVGAAFRACPMESAGFFRGAK